MLRGKKIRWFKEMLIKQRQNELILNKMSQIAEQMGNALQDKNEVINEF